MVCGPVISFLSSQAAGFSETLLAVYQTLRCPFPEDCTVPVFVRLSAYLLTVFMLGRCAILTASYSGHAFLLPENTISHIHVSVNRVDLSLFSFLLVTMLHTSVLVLCCFFNLLLASLFFHVSDSRCYI